MIIGCNAYIEWDGKIVAIQCSKGRGIILPGGKWDGPHETFKDAALRELKEETGLIGHSPKYLWGGFSVDGAYVYSFKVSIEKFNPVKTEEGLPRLATWRELKNSAFRAYYEILEQIVCQERI